MSYTSNVCSSSWVATKRIVQMMALARRLSLKSTYEKYKIGAVIARKGRVVGVGFNRHKTHTLSPHAYKYLHAEVDAALGVPVKQLKGATIYVYREKKDGTPGLARPCSSCEGFLKKHGVKTVVYTTDTEMSMEEI